MFGFLPKRTERREKARRKIVSWHYIRTMTLQNDTKAAVVFPWYIWSQRRFEYFTLNSFKIHIGSVDRTDHHTNMNGIRSRTPLSQTVREIPYHAAGQNASMLIYSTIIFWFALVRLLDQQIDQYILFPHNQPAMRFGEATPYLAGCFDHRLFHLDLIVIF